MKQRIISAIVGLLLLLFILLFYHTVIFNIAIAIIAAIAVYEVLEATHYIKSKLILFSSIGYALFVPFFGTREFGYFPIMMTLGYFCLLFTILLLQHNKVRFEEIAISFFVSLVIPIAFATTVLIRDRYTTHGLFYTLLVCVAAWVSDSAAYFVGRAFGKHKLAPQISPNKTIEGAVAGVLSSGVFFLLFSLGYEYLMQNAQINVKISYWIIFLIGIFCSLLGIAGDLMASLIKRQTGIKDFGNIMPGHGGIMDRFDSFLFVAPTLFLLLKLFPIVV